MLHTTFDIARKYLTWYFLLLVIFDELVMVLLETSLMIRISEGQHYFIPYYLLVKILSPVISNFLVRPIVRGLAYKVKHDFKAISTEKFNRMSFESKNTKTSTTFWEKLGSATFSVYMLIDWGLSTSMNLMSILCSVIWVFIQKNLIMELLVALLCCSILYYLFIRNKQNTYTALDKNTKKIIQYIRSKIQLDLIPFQYREYGPDHIIGQSKQIEDRYEHLDLQWNYIIAYTNTSNQLISSVLSYFVADDIPSFMLIMITMNQLTGAISNSTSFMTQFNRIKNDYATLEDFWIGAKFEEEPEKMYPTNDLKVTDVDVIRSSGEKDTSHTIFRVRLDSSCGAISLAPGEKIYIHGPTGDGKSTFVKAILGQIDGATANIGQLKNYYHHVADYFQEIKEKMPSSKISIRDYFKGEPDDTRIDEYLLRVFKPKQLTRIKETLLAQTGDDVIIDFASNNTIIDIIPEKTSPYDMAINEKISGGEKSRLLLTLRGHETDINNKGIIVLDEPCPDVDHDTYTDILNLFFENYNHCTIIMIGHLCECKKANLKVKWTQQFTIVDGLVSRD